MKKFLQVETDDMSRRARTPPTARTRSTSPPIPRHQRPPSNLRDRINRLVNKVRLLDRRMGTVWTAAQEREQRRNVTRQLQDEIIAEEEDYIAELREDKGKPNWTPTAKQRQVIHDRSVAMAYDVMLEKVKDYVETPIVNVPFEGFDDGDIANIQELGELWNEEPPPPPTNAGLMMREFFNEDS